MGRVKQSVVAMGTSEASFEFSDLVYAVHQCHCNGRADIEIAVREQLIRNGWPASMLADGSAEMGLVTKLARSLDVATLSFGMLKLNQERALRTSASTSKLEAEVAA